MKYVDTEKYISMLKEVVEEGHEASMLISGSSMAPFLCHQRDTIVFGQPNRELRVGDIVFYRRPGGQYVVHRICRVCGDSYDIIGDHQTEIEHGVPREQIFGLVTRVKRKGKWLRPGDFWWEFFARLWVRMISLRPAAVRLYGVFGKGR